MQKKKTDSSGNDIMDPKTLQYLMGHSDISVTLNTYIGILETKKNEQASKGLLLNDREPFH